ncbi:hypothetical protein ACH5RR_006641 [Cinchona calisaya]|uniref:Uncharacterized protein n=1 Tax=Cinchona calisaya TaxID=153742 RepID=A0ABD3APK5_9GENT
MIWVLESNCAKEGDETGKDEGRVRGRQVGRERWLSGRKEEGNGIRECRQLSKTLGTNVLSLYFETIGNFTKAVVAWRTMWNIRNGNSLRLWWDDRTGMGTLRSLLIGPMKLEGIDLKVEALPEPNGS